jgi:hypothetical protein
VPLLSVCIHIHFALMLAGGAGTSMPPWIGHALLGRLGNVREAPQSGGAKDYETLRF